MTVCSPSEYLWVTLVVPLSVLVTVVQLPDLGILDGGLGVHARLAVQGFRWR